jgi:hypothetical protein
MHRIVAIALILNVFGVFSQDSLSKKQPPLLYKHSLHLELLGKNAIAVGVNYEMLKTFKRNDKTGFVFGNGIAYGHIINYGDLSISHYAHLFYGKKIAIEGGLGYSSYFSFRPLTNGKNRKEFFETEQGIPYIPFYESALFFDLGFTFRLGKSTIKPYGVIIYSYTGDSKRTFFPWFGLSYGYAIK